MTGRVILLVGPSCAGKSTLAKAIQAASPEPFLLQSLDGLFASTPDRWGGSGGFAPEGFRYDWDPPPPEGGRRVRRVACGPVGRRLLQGFHRAVAAYAASGVNVVVDDMLLDLAVLEDWAVALGAVPTLLVNLTPPLDELLRREAARTVHATPGLTEGHFELHRGIAADVRLDTSAIGPEAAATMLLGFETPLRSALQTFKRVAN